jgi:hypothetical protein
MGRRVLLMDCVFDAADGTHCDLQLDHGGQMFGRDIHSGVGADDQRHWYFDDDGTQVVFR